jgi:hypothetical protein
MKSNARLVLSVELDDTEPYQVETRLIDHNTWDTTRAKHNWPQAGDAPITWLGFVAWAASRRSGKIPADYTWETFLRNCVGVEKVNDEDEDADSEEDAPTPIRAVAGLG